MSKSTIKNNTKGLLKDLFVKFKALPRRKQILYIAIAIVVIAIIPLPDAEETPSIENNVEITDDAELNENQIENSNKEKDEEKEEEIPFEELSFEDQVNKIVNEQGRGKVVDVNTDYGEINITLEMEDNLTNGLIVGAMKRKAFWMLEGLQSIVEQNNINNVTITYQTTFADKYGNESLGNACIISIDTTELIKVNFKNVIPEDLDNFCTVYIHPSLKN